MSTKNSGYLGGVLLVAGTCIGAGMIGVPVKTAAAGFYPTLVAFILVLVAMTISALLFLEASLAFHGEVNFISMTQATLGNVAKHIAWGASLFYMYTIMAAYTTGGSTMLVECLPINLYLAILIYLLPFALLLFLGAKWLDIVNRFFTIGLIISFIMLCGSVLLGAHSLQPATNFAIPFSALEATNTLIFALPLLVTTFGYHVIIPSLKFYLKENVNVLVKTILLGGAIPLLVYVIWQIVILLLIPVFGDQGLVSELFASKNPGNSITNYLITSGQHKSVLIFLFSFMFCAISSSLIGVSWALHDFLADGFKITKHGIGKVILVILTFIPPIIYAVCFPQGFLKALGLAGACSSIIMIVYPALMVYKIRKSGHTHHSKTTTQKYKVPVNNALILAVAAFGVIVVFLELMN